MPRINPKGVDDGIQSNHGDLDFREVDPDGNVYHYDKQKFNTPYPQPMPNYQ